MYLIYTLQVVEISGVSYSMLSQEPYQGGMFDTLQEAQQVAQKASLIEYIIVQH
jgi:hypothetical protein